MAESLDAAIAFFAEFGLELEGRGTIEGDRSGRVTGLREQRVEIAMTCTPDAQPDRTLAIPHAACGRRSPERSGECSWLPACQFAVDDLDGALARLRDHGAQLVDEVVQYEDVYRFCYVRGPEGILIGLAQQIG